MSLVGDVVQAVVGAISAGLLIGTLWGTVAGWDFLARNPEILANDAVRETNAANTQLALALMAPILVATAVGLIFASWSSYIYPILLELLPRLVVVAILMFSVLYFLDWESKLSDALTQAVRPQGPNLPQILGIVTGSFAASFINQYSGFIFLLQYAIKNFYILFAAGAVPFFLLTLLTPATEWVARTFARLFHFAVWFQFLEMLALQAGMRLLEGRGSDAFGNWWYGTALISFLVVLPSFFLVASFGFIAAPARAAFARSRGFWPRSIPRRGASRRPAPEPTPAATYSVRAPVPPQPPVHLSPNLYREVNLVHTYGGGASLPPSRVTEPRSHGR